jgi:hypothetical protein
VDASLSRAEIVKVNDPHGWNSYNHYRKAHEKFLAEHPFLDDSRPNTIEFEFVRLDGVLYLVDRIESLTGAQNENNPNYCISGSA